MKRQFNYKVDGKEWEEAKSKAFDKIVKNKNVDGFRKGKIPRSVFEKRYGNYDIVIEASEDLINKEYRRIILEEKIVPLVEPKLEIVKEDNDGLEVNIIFIVDSEVELGKYKGLNIKKDKVEVTKEEVEHQVGHILDRYAELVSKDGAAENGDTVIIDFKGFKDNAEFDGGSSNGYSLELGSHIFIPGFEEGIVGMKKGESKDIELTFPEDYMEKEFAGSKVVFNVLVNDIKERVIPELDDEFFEDLSMDGVSNKEELYKAVEDEIRKQKEKDNEALFEEKLLEMASNNMKVEIDDELVDFECKKMYDKFIADMESRGISENFYLKYSKRTKEDIMSDMRDSALKKVKYTYLLSAIVKEENISVDNADIEEEINRLADMYQMTYEDVKESINNDNEDIEYNLLMNKALKLLKENN